MELATTTRRQRWVPLAASGLMAVVLIGVASLINGWLYAVLLFATWALLTYGVRSFVDNRSRLLLVSVTTFILGSVLWDYTSRQPRVGVDEVVLRKVPSSVVPGSVDVILRNAGGDAANIVVVSVGHLAAPFSSARASRVEADLTDRLTRAQPVPPSGTMSLPSTQKATVSVEVPFSERAWVFDRGEATLLVAGRVRYRDRVFRRETQFCQFLNVRTSSWTSCPFLND